MLSHDKKSFVVFLILWALTFCFCYPGTPWRCANLAAEWLRHAMFFILPLLLMTVGFRYFKPRSGWSMFVPIVVSVMFLIPGCLWLIWFSDMLSPHSTVEQHEGPVVIDGKKFEKYVCNYQGATGGFETVYRDEVIVFPGIMLIRSEFESDNR